MYTDWERLIRFKTEEGHTFYGQPESTGDTQDLQSEVKQGNVTARIISAPNGIFGTDVSVTPQTVKVKELLPPLSRNDVPIIRCIGLNYKKHSE